MAELTKVQLVHLKNVYDIVCKDGGIKALLEAETRPAGL
jgi:hypothetical protein